LGDRRVVAQRVDADDVGALGREPDGVRLSLAAGDSGDERYLAVKQAHEAAPPSHHGGRLLEGCRTSDLTLR